MGEWENGKPGRQETRRPGERETGCFRPGIPDSASQSPGLLPTGFLVYRSTPQPVFRLFLPSVRGRHLQDGQCFPRRFGPRETGEVGAAPVD